MSAAVIGVGSPFGFDRLGWDVIDRLRSDRAVPADVRLEHNQRLGAPLMAQLADVDFIILVDAIRSGAAAGTLHRFEPDAPWLAQRGLSSHGFGLAETLGLARALDRLPARVRVLGLEAGIPDQPPSSAEIARLATAVCRELRGYLAAQCSPPPLK